MPSNQQCPSWEFICGNKNTDTGQDIYCYWLSAGEGEGDAHIVGCHQPFKERGQLPLDAGGDSSRCWWV